MFLPDVDGDGNGVRDGHVVLLGVDDHRGLFPLDGQGQWQGQRDGQDSLLGLHVLEKERGAHEAFEEHALLELRLGFGELEHECRGEEDGEGHREDLTGVHGLVAEMASWSREMEKLQLVLDGRSYPWT